MRQHPINYLNMPGYIGETWNPAIGCFAGMPCSKHCWARKMAVRMAGMDAPTGAREVLTPDGSDWNGEWRARPDQLRKLYHWKQPRCVAVQYMGDIARVGFCYAGQIWDSMRDNPRHRYLLLTKRPASLSLLDPPWDAWIGVSVMGEADFPRIRELRNIPADVRWVSFEPFITARNIPNLEGIDWIVIGAGRGYPPIDLGYVQRLIAEARRCNCAVWVKQLSDERGRVTDDMAQFPPQLRIRQLPEVEP